MSNDNAFDDKSHDEVFWKGNVFGCTHKILIIRFRSNLEVNKKLNGLKDLT